MKDSSIEQAGEIPVISTPESPLSARGASGLPFQVATLFGARLLMGVNSVVTGVIVARWLGVKQLGAFAVLNVTMAYAVQIGSLGLASANTYFIARDRSRLSRAAMNSLIFSILAGAIIALLTVWLARASPQLFEDIPLLLVVIAAAAVPFQLITLMGLNIFLAVGQVQRSNILDLLGQSLLLVNAFVAVVLLHRGLPPLITLNAAAAILVSLLVSWQITNYIARHVSTRDDAAKASLDGALFRQMMRYGLKVQLQTIAGLLLFRIDLLIVKYFRGSTEAGVYSVASQVALLLMLLPGVISTLLFPRIAATKDERGTLACLVTRHTAFVMFVICIASVPALFLIRPLYGPAFAPAVVQALILMPGVFLVSVSGVLSQHFSGTGLPLPIPFFWVTTLIFNTLANFAIVPVLGARGAAISSSISYALIFVLISLYFRFRTGIHLGEAYFISAKELRGLFSARHFLRRP